MNTNKRLFSDLEAGTWFIVELAIPGGSMSFTMKKVEPFQNNLYPPFTTTVNAVEDNGTQWHVRDDQYVLPTTSNKP